jgi:hypothetical protein
VLTHASGRLELESRLEPRRDSSRMVGNPSLIGKVSFAPDPGATSLSAYQSLLLTSDKRKSTSLLSNLDRSLIEICRHNQSNCSRERSIS